MSTWISTVDIAASHMEVPALNDRRSEHADLRRLALIALLMCVLFALSDHDWLISRYEAFSESSEFMEQVSTEGNFLRRISIFILGAVSCVALARRGTYPLQIRGALATLMIAAALWCLASWLWATEPGFAIRRLVAYACIATAALAAAKLFNPRELAVVALLCSATFLILGGMVEIALGSWQPWKGDYRFAGTLHPNSQGLNCALLVIAAAYLAQHANRYRAALWTLAAIGFIALWLTKSRTPLAAVVFAEALFFFFAGSVKQKIVTGLAAIWIGCLALLIVGPDVADHAVDAALLGRTDAEDAAALTGRIPLWEDLWSSVATRPWTGYGFNAFWTPDRIDDISDSQAWAISAAHSTYLDLALGIGLIGAGLYAAILLLALFKVVRWHIEMPTIGFDFIGVLLTFVVLHGLMESAFANPGFVPLMALSALAMVGFVNRHNYEATTVGI